MRVKFSISGICRINNSLWRYLNFKCFFTNRELINKLWEQLNVIAIKKRNLTSADKIEQIYVKTNKWLN